MRLRSCLNPFSYQVIEMIRFPGQMFFITNMETGQLLKPVFLSKIIVIVIGIAGCVGLREPTNPYIC